MLDRHSSDHRRVLFAGILVEERVQIRRVATVCALVGGLLGLEGVPLIVASAQIRSRQGLQPPELIDGLSCERDVGHLKNQQPAAPGALGLARTHAEAVALPHDVLDGGLLVDFAQPGAHAPRLFVRGPTRELRI